MNYAALKSLNYSTFKPLDYIALKPSDNTALKPSDYAALSSSESGVSVAGPRRNAARGYPQCSVSTRVVRPSVTAYYTGQPASCIAAEGRLLQLYIYSKTSLNRLTTGPTLYGPFREMVGLER